MVLQVVMVHTSGKLCSEFIWSYINKVIVFLVRLLWAVCFFFFQEFYVRKSDGRFVSHMTPEMFDLMFEFSKHGKQKCFQLEFCYGNNCYTARFGGVAGG